MSICEMRLYSCITQTYFHRLGRSLGSGTFGKVRIGTHTITGEKVAIKILEKDRIKDKGDVERVTREINILKKVRHPNVIQLYEVSIHSNISPFGQLVCLGRLIIETDFVFF